ncbi:hypothetical protein [Paraburkholderia hospita]|uniref:hypothetical protein n=1 Tax=Paraburkholderia hospita TaxID=169430 RepID=UPI0009D2F491|nr:hypothetical protein [Paraburkholderia hospita]SKC49543.1 hypothetical protein SAMN05446934_0289 [Paraburkholderia hospita]
MSKLQALLKTLPSLSPAIIATGAPIKYLEKALPHENVAGQLARYAAAIEPNIAAIIWLETLVEEKSAAEARDAFLSLADIDKAVVMNGHLIRNHGKHRVTFDGSKYISRFVVKPQSTLTCRYDFPVTTWSALASGVAA